MNAPVLNHPQHNQAPSCHGGLENLDEEYDYWIEDVTGSVPEALRGTFFRNGPGRQRIGGKPYGHWFDGDGMLCAFTFTNGRVHFRNRYVRTPKYVEETAAQAVRYRGFGTQVPGGWKNNVLRMPANPANTNTVWHGGHLLALKRLDGVAPISAYIAPEKARCAALGRRDSGVYEKMINDGRVSFLSAPILSGMLEGGVPIVIAGHVVGAVGVSGVKSSEDAQIAKAGIAALG